MANRWCDGFGRYGGTKSYMLNGSSGQAWAQVDALFSLSSANPRTGNWHLRLVDGSAGGLARRVFGAPLTEVFFGMAFYCSALPSEESHGTTGGGLDGVVLCSFQDQSNGRQCRLLLGTDGSIELRDAGLNVLGRSVPVIGAGAYQHIEVYGKAGNGTGAIEVRVDEVTRLNLTGIDTVATANVEFSQVIFGTEQHSGGTYPTLDFADVYANDTTDDGSGCNTFIGDCKSGVLMVNADTAQADFSKSSGTSGYSLIDETPPNDSGYIFTASTTGESDFELEDTPSNLTEILTVRPFMRAMKDDAGTASIAPNMKSGSTKGTVDAQPCTTAFAYYDSNVPFDPATGVPWTKTGLDAAKHVAERTA